MVCVHGITTPSEGFSGLADLLGDMGYRVLLYDLYGRGFSDHVTGAQDRAFFHQQLQDLLAHEGIVEDFILIGYSAGGSIATSFAADNLPRVRQLILIASVGLHAPNTPVASFMERRPGLQDLILRWTYPMAARRYIKSHLSDPHSPSTVIQAQQAQTRRRGFFPANLAAMRGILRGDFAPEHQLFHRQGLPVLAIWAGDDKVIPRQVIGTAGRAQSLRQTGRGGRGRPRGGLHPPRRGRRNHRREPARRFGLRGHIANAAS